jgi:hypothetical protein
MVVRLVNQSVHKECSYTILYSKMTPPSPVSEQRSCEESSENIKKMMVMAKGNKELSLGEESLVQISMKDDDTNNSERTLDVNHNHTVAAAQTAVLQERLKELEEALEKEKAEHVEKDEFIEELREALQSQEEIMTDLQKRHREKSGDIVRFKAELFHVKKRQTTTNAENEELISDIHDVLEESHDLKQELAERDVLVEALKGDLHDMEKSKNELLEEFEKQHEADFASSGLSEAYMDEALENERSTLERRIKNMDLERIHLEQHMSSLDSKLNVAEDQLESAAAEHRRYKMQVEGLTNKMRSVFSKGEIREELDRIELMLIPTNMTKKEDPTAVSQENSSALMGRMRRRASMATFSIMGGAGSSDAATRRPKVKDKEMHLLQSPSTLQPHQPSPKATSKATEGTHPKRASSARRASIFGTAGSQNVSQQPESVSVPKRSAIDQHEFPLSKIESSPSVDDDFVGLGREENAKPGLLQTTSSKREVVAKGTNIPSPAAAVSTNDTDIALALASALPNFLDAVRSTIDVEAPVKEISNKKEPSFAKIMVEGKKTKQSIAPACGTTTPPDEPLGLLVLPQSNNTIKKKTPTAQEDEGHSIEHNGSRSAILEPDMGVLDAFAMSSPSRAELELQSGTSSNNLFVNVRERAMGQIDAIKKQINTTSPNANDRFTCGRPRQTTRRSDGETLGPETKTATGRSPFLRVPPIMRHIMPFRTPAEREATTTPKEKDKLPSANRLERTVTVTECESESVRSCSTLDNDLDPPYHPPQQAGDKSCEVLFRVRRTFGGDHDDDDDDSIGSSAIVPHADVELYEGFGNKATDDPPGLIIPHASIELYEGFR